MHGSKTRRTFLKNLQGFFSSFLKSFTCGWKPRSNGIVKQGKAMRVVFFYEGEEGTYIENVRVTLYQSGIVHLRSEEEETSIHLQNCEILWKFQDKTDSPSGKVRLLPFKKPSPPEHSE
jgi:hypothetical protein